MQKEVHGVLPLTIRIPQRRIHFLIGGHGLRNLENIMNQSIATVINKTTTEIAPKRSAEGQSNIRITCSVLFDRKRVMIWKTLLK